MNSVATYSTNTSPQRIAAYWIWSETKAARWGQVLGVLILGAQFFTPVMRGDLPMAEIPALLLGIGLLLWLTMFIARVAGNAVLRRLPIIGTDQASFRFLAEALTTYHPDQANALLSRVVFLRKLAIAGSVLPLLPYSIISSEVTTPNEHVWGMVVSIAGFHGLIAFGNYVSTWITVSSGMFPEMNERKRSIERGMLLDETIADASELVEQAKRALGNSESPPIIWGMLPISDAVACRHFLIHGDTGSGKSVMLKHLLLQSLARARTDKDQRIFLNDPKGDMASILTGENIKSLYLNPFDQRGHAWDMAQDLNSLTRIQDFAKLLCPEEGVSQPFFPRAARDMVCSVLEYFNSNAKHWTLRDLLLALQRRDVITTVMARTQSGRQFLDGIEDIEKTFGSIRSEINTKINLLRPLAAAFYAASEKGRTYSVSGFCDRSTPEQVWVLNQNGISNEAMDVLCRQLFFFLYRAIATWPEVSSPRTWVFIDEARVFADMDELSRIADEGRSKGLTLCLATQSVTDFIAFAKRSSKAAHNMITRIPNKILLRCVSEDAAWCSKQFGSVYKKYHTNSFSNQYSSQGHTSTDGTSEQFTEVAAVAGHVFTEMPFASYEGGVSMLVVSDPSIGGGFWRANLPKEHFPPRPSTPTSDYDLPKGQLDTLPEWNFEDLERLNLLELAGTLDNAGELAVNSEFGTDTQNLSEGQDWEQFDDDEYFDDDEIDEDGESNRPWIPGIDF